MNVFLHSARQAIDREWIPLQVARAQNSIQSPYLVECNLRLLLPRIAYWNAGSIASGSRPSQSQERDRRADHTACGVRGESAKAKASGAIVRVWKQQIGRASCRERGSIS